jgi:hypothetical protein
VHRSERWQTARTSTSSKAGSKRTVPRSVSAIYVRLALKTLLFPSADICTLDLEAVDGIINHLLYLSPKRGLLFVTDTEGPERTPSGLHEHLSCFIAGVLALGHATLPNPPETHLWAAEGLAHTCWVTYADMPTGLGPDEVRFRSPFHGTEEKAEHERWEKGEYKWTLALERWEEGGRKGKPPGTGQAGPVPVGATEEEREWTMVPGKEQYLLRPEVGFSPVHLHMASELTFLCRRRSSRSSFSIG